MTNKMTPYSELLQLIALLARHAALLACSAAGEVHELATRARPVLRAAALHRGGLAARSLRTGRRQLHGPEPRSRAAANLAAKALRPACKHERTALRAAPVTRPDLNLTLHRHQRPPRRWGVVPAAVALHAAGKVVAAAAGTLPVARAGTRLLPAREASLAPVAALTTLAPEARLLARSRAPGRRVVRRA